MDVMIDIETMSADPTNALILSIAAVRFEIAIEWDAGPVFLGKERGGEFYALPNVREQLALGRQTSESTAQWWSTQSESARDAWAGEERLLRYVLSDLYDFCREPGTTRDVRAVWAWGVCFDISNLESLYRRNGAAVPWKYNAVRDARTIGRELPARRERPPEAKLWPDGAHHPISDCYNQIWSLWENWPCQSV